VPSAGAAGHWTYGQASLEAVFDIDSVLEIACYFIGACINCHLTDEITSDRDIIVEWLVRGSVFICTSVQHAFLEQKYIFNGEEHLVSVLNSYIIYSKSKIYLLFLATLKSTNSFKSLHLVPDCKSLKSKILILEFKRRGSFLPWLFHSLG
jgi:hypothetical protein